MLIGTITVWLIVPCFRNNPTQREEAEQNQETMLGSSCDVWFGAMQAESLAAALPPRKQADWFSCVNQTELGDNRETVLPGVNTSFVAFGFFALAMGGCATPAFQPTRLGLKLPPAALGSSISLQQHLIVERGGRIDELDTALEVDSQSLDLVGLAFRPACADAALRW